MASLLSGEQRKGLLYGALISAGLAAAAASRRGGNIIDAMGAGVAGATSGYAGGLNQIVRLKHAEIETQKSEELMKAAKETQGLRREQFEWQQIKDLSAQEEKTRKEVAETREIEGVREWARREGAKKFSGMEFPLGATEEPTLPPNLLEVLGIAPRTAIKDILVKGAERPKEPKKPTTKMLVGPDNELYEWTPGTPIKSGSRMPKTYDLVVQAGDRVEIRDRTTGAVKETIKTGVPPSTKAQIEAQAQRDREKPPPKLEPETWINMETYEEVRVDPRDRAKMQEFMKPGSPWEKLSEALRKYPFLGFELMKKKRKPGKAQTQPPEGFKEFEIIKVE